MKKEYVAPRAEKMEFNYSEAVVAASSACKWVIPMGDGFKDCVKTPQGPGEANNILAD